MRKKGAKRKSRGTLNVRVLAQRRFVKEQSRDKGKKQGRRVLYVNGKKVARPEWSTMPYCHEEVK